MNGEPAADLSAALIQPSSNITTLPAFDTPMITLAEQFAKALITSQNLTNRPDPLMLLKLYGLYKQGSCGDVAKERPGFSELIGRAKWDAWHNYIGMPTETAQQQFIDLVNEL